MKAPRQLVCFPPSTLGTRRSTLLPMLELEDALQRILAALPAPVSERVALPDAADRVLTETVASQVDLPPFDNSSMDGYAVRAADVAAARPEAPIRLRVVGRTAAGEVFAGTLAGGDCVRLFTGSPLPRGADAVVMQEDTRSDPALPEEIQVLDTAKPWANVRFRGEDLKRGTTVANAGEIVTPAKLSLLAATGTAQVTVGRQPVVGLLATGSELREPGQALAPGQIYESTRVALEALARRAGAQPRIYALVPDTLAATQGALEQAFGDCDLVVTSGGVSVGEMDFIKAAFEQLGGKLEFWKVAIKPGRPFVFGKVEAKMEDGRLKTANLKRAPSSIFHPLSSWKLLFGLPGNPVSALVTFLLLVRPALLRWQGTQNIGLPSQPGVLSEPLANPDARRHFLRVRVDKTGRVSSAGLQASHALSSAAAADGLVDVPPRTTLTAGTTVSVLRWD